MSDREPQTQSRVTLEDLLRLKRAERPPREFWAGFERDLRQKQLAALVERRSWWHGPVAALSRFGWLRVPVAAAAVFAVTLVSIGKYGSSSRYRDEQPLVVTRRPALVAMASSTPANARPAESPRPVPSSAQAAVEGQALPESSEARSVEPDAVQTAAAPAAGMVKRVADLEDTTNASGSEPLKGSVAIQLGSPGVEPALVEAAARPVGFEDRAISTLRFHRATEALPTAVAATEQRWSRLLAALGSDGVYAPEPSAPEHVKRSAIRYLAEDGLDRSMSRLQAEADHLSIRF